ncbi:MAG: lipoyl(octanoyl) transferase LipB [Candidatus Marinimicrobia bacterium]|nr:lipoyl(octanoyl) transferase LipB [Candidatus Neomarinimicrobiota bacterium]MCF7904514.1 lipoyl(octanoyl) transferase LipB [Candidatus Neomarinimicrobiota bacterium]
MKNLTVIRMGLVPYEEAWNFQRDMHAKRLAGEINDTLILLEHPPVYTLGKNAGDENLIDPGDAEVIQSDRGGDITWHGPGQLVGYPIFNLEDHQKSVSWYMRSLEDTIIKTLQKFAIDSERIRGLTGVWVGDKKVCAMGVRLSRWVTMHGFALNVRPKMSYFNGMIPCGIQGKGVTSLKELLNKDIEISAVTPFLIDAFSSIFGFDQIEERAD